jgi:hypothetical protein
MLARRRTRGNTLRTIRAFINDDFRFAAGGVELQVGTQELNDAGLPVRTDAVLTMQDEHGNPVNASLRWHFIEEHERGMMLTGAALRLEEGVGQAILEALARHYHGTSDTHRMANDLGRERQRRDQAEDRLWNILDRFSTELSMETNAADPVAMQLAQYLPALSLAVSRATDPPPVGSPPLQFHHNTLCRGHMPWDFVEVCSE